MTDEYKVSAWELKKHLSRQVRKLRLQYKIIILLLVLICLAICGHVIFYYNYLTDLQYDVLTEESKVRTAVQYRNNLIPALVESVRSFVQHEDNVFNRTVDARERTLSVNKLLSGGDRRPTDDASRDVLQRIMAIGEQYPLLKTGDSYQLLMKQLSEAEEKIMAQRILYSDVLNTYTTAMSMFPGNIYAALFGFPSYDYFKCSKGSEWSPIGISK
ncbi:MAG: LemA family protein [Deltaproteobacteria bacterium]|nr:LemA family protein [Deltaproteobacteria bacterium]